LWFTSKRGKRHQRLARPRIMSVQVVNSGYLVVHLCQDGTRRSYTVHSLVAATFIGPRPKGSDVAHNDGDRLNNTLGNLRYATRKENHADKNIHGTAARGSKIKQAKLKEADIPEIRALQGKARTADVAAQFKVSSRAIRRVFSRQSWRHV